jgi:hypothetical protein
LKDHKPQFMNNPKCRVINPCKSELGMVSSNMLAKIISVVKEKSQLQQWKNTNSVIEWFKGLEHKSKLHFIQFDVINFYASITPDLVESSLTFAAMFTDISDEMKATILQATKSFLCSNGATWVKKSTGTFDVTMGGFHGAEICELVGLFLLHQLRKIIPNVGLYRDDGLAVSSATPRQIDIMKKKICKVFEDNSLSITIEANQKSVNFLDINMDLRTEIYKPFMKENDAPLYVNARSNHPPSVLKSIPLGINRRLSRISANKAVFEAAAPVYQEALIKSGHNHRLVYEPPEECNTKKKCRRKSVTWFNPPFSSSVKTNIGRDFLALLDKAFPPANPLHKLFTRQTVKLSYKCMPNMGRAVATNNMKLLKDEQPQQPQTLGCNCQGGLGTCPVQGKCRTAGVVYRATITETASGQSETYTGMTGRQFKDRWREHMGNTRNESGREKSRLSIHIWNLKDNQIDYNLDWQILERATTFNPITKKCGVCLKEKYFIMYDRPGSSLNKRQEVFNTCRHRKQKLLDSFKT